MSEIAAKAVVTRQRLRLALFRMDELLELPVALVETPADTVTLLPRKDATDEQRARRLQWLGAQWPEEG